MQGSATFVVKLAGFQVRNKYAVLALLGMPKQECQLCRLFPWLMFASQAQLYQFVAQIYLFPEFLCAKCFPFNVHVRIEASLRLREDGSVLTILGP